MSDNSITLVDRTFNLNGKQYRYQKEGRRPYDKFVEADTKGQIKDGEFARTDTILAEIKPNGEEEVLIHDMTSAYIENNKGVQRAHGRYNNKSGNSVCVVKEADNPKANKMLSIILLFPEPLGPEIVVKPLSIGISTLLANDLKLSTSSCFIYI